MDTDEHGSQNLKTTTFTEGNRGNEAEKLCPPMARIYADYSNLRKVIAIEDHEGQRLNNSKTVLKTGAISFSPSGEKVRMRGQSLAITTATSFLETL